MPSWDCTVEITTQQEVELQVEAGTEAEAIKEAERMAKEDSPNPLLEKVEVECTSIYEIEEADK